MDDLHTQLGRRALLAALGSAMAMGLAAPLRAAGLGTGLATGLGGGLLDLLGRASDTSLDKLGQPGAFYTDPAVRIALPLIGRATGGLGGTLLSMLDKGQQLGLTDNLVRKLNDAAGFAAKEAKPVFRNAIGRLSLTDVPNIATQRDGATQYLRTSAGPDLGLKLRPLVDKGLANVGALRELDRLSARSSLLRSGGLTRDRVAGSVTEQALNGIFSYIGGEEGRLRDNPAGALGGVLKGILGN